MEDLYGTSKSPSPGGYYSTLPPEMQERLLTAQINRLYRQVSADIKSNDEQKIRSGIEALRNVDASLTLKCKHVKIEELFGNNTQNEVSLEKLQTCFNIISKYAQNLLKGAGQRPANWRTVLFSNQSFSQKVDCIRGSRDILIELGYSNITKEGLVFVGEPNYDRVSRYLADLLLIDEELEMYTNRSHPYPHHIDQLLPLNLRLHQFDNDTSQSSPGSRSSEYLSPTSQGSVHSVSSVPLVTELPGKTGEDDEFHDAVEFQTDEICDICGTNPPVSKCVKCDNKLLCTECDSMWHKHRLRKDHVREKYQPSPSKSKQRQQHIQPSPWQQQTQSPWQQQSQQTPYSGVGARPKVPLNFPPQQTSTPQELPRNTSTVQYGTAGDNRPILSIFEREESGRNNTPGGIAQVSEEAIVRPKVPPPVKPKPRRVSSELEESLFGTPDSHSGGGATPGQTMKRSQSLLEEIKAISDKEERIRRIKQELGKLDNVLDQYKQEVNVIVRKQDDFENNPEYQRLSKERDRFNRAKMLLDEHWKELEKEKFENKEKLKRVGRSLGEGPRHAILRGSESEESFQIKYPPHASSQDQAGDALFDFERDINFKDTLLQQSQSKVGGAVTPKKPKIEISPDQERLVTEKGDINSGRTVLREPHAWVCDHCTYHNNMKDKSCAVCGETTEKPSFVFHETDDENEIKRLSPWRETEGNKEVPHQNLSPKAPDGRGSSKSPSGGYRSVFVEQQDEIFREKQLAKEKFRLQQLEEEKIGKQTPVPVARQTEPAKKPVPVKKSVAFDTKQHRQTSYGGTDIDMKTKLDQLAEERQQEEANTQAREIIRILRKAETEGYDIREVELALRQPECVDVFKWLKNQWKVQVRDLIKQAERSLQQQQIQHGRHVTEQVGHLVTEKEAKAALIDCWGDTSVALCQILSNREAMAQELLDMYSTYTKDHVLELLHNYNYSKMATDQALTEELFEPFKTKLWPEQDPVYDSIDHPRLRSSEDLKEAKIRNKDIDREARTRMVLCEYEDYLHVWGRAEVVVKVLEEVDESIHLTDVVEAVRQCGDRQTTLRFLRQECEICYCTFPANMILNTTNCQCKVCRECMRGYFENQVKERHIKNLCCPVCQEPDIEANEYYLTYLDNFLKPLISRNIYDLFQNKVRDWHLQKDPNFRWCSTENCENGFIFNPDGNRLKMRCGKCFKYTCFKCKKPWEDQHQGITCEEFRQWKEENNPEFQEAGLAKHLQENGIDCPQCKMRYSLAKGGCMHFKCTQCGHEFCCGCNKPFMQGRACKELRGCKNAGLHCHHPRDCLYYLRDRDIAELQELLTDNNVEFQRGNQQDNNQCKVMEQKEQQAGLIDEACGKAAVQAGLCEIHYKEYLVDKINSNGIDPVTIMAENDLKIQFTRREKQAPAREQDEGETQYKNRLINLVKQTFPLERRQQAVI